MEGVRDGGETAVAARRRGSVVVVWLALSVTVFLLPVADLAGDSLGPVAQVVELEGRSAVEGLGRSSELVRDRWLRVASLVGVGALLALRPAPSSARF